MLLGRGGLAVHVQLERQPVAQLPELARRGELASRRCRQVEREALAHLQMCLLHEVHRILISRELEVEGGAQLGEGGAQVLERDRRLPQRRLDVREQVGLQQRQRDVPDDDAAVLWQPVGRGVKREGRDEREVDGG